MIVTGKRRQTETQWVWDANTQRKWLVPVLVWFILGGGLFMVFAAVGAATGFVVNGKRDVLLTLLMGGLGLAIVCGSLAGLGWRDVMTFHLLERRYERNRGFYPRVERVEQGSFDEFSLVEVLGWDCDGAAYAVNLLWKDGAHKPFCFGVATAPKEANRLGGEIASQFGLLLEERWRE